MTTKEQLINERRKRYQQVTDLMFRTMSVHKDSLWNDFKHELDNYSAETYEPAQRGARLTAAIKNFKTRRMTDFVVHVVLSAHVDEFDMTPLTIRKLSKGLFNGRSGSQKNLVELFGCEGRTRKASKRTHELIDELADRYQNDAKKLMAKTEIDIEAVKGKYRTLI
ncbi:hypothetical protein NOK75_25415 [Vibrio parahaemolyticus]|nr:hypothetical protein [Vibrio parahaemolyticus]MCX8774016.1 hypothetical protein [Vibrio parahaemolyticus]MCX8814291.1 hypothetical protein [Vibrio parahaemolyticus]MCX8845203.1 hypothetical protein [Vibrio parahaemolyticus]MCX8855121.1 hypothetical protein [Vibrio parahaemolyticus]MCX8865370.1 hypothetical protein [Vibrio parahaemolyticus]